MSVTHIKIKQLKVLKDIDKQIDGKHILLLGENGTGKSTIIQAIRIALGDTSIVPPYIDGKWEVEVMQDGKKYLLSVKLKEGKPLITITGEDGLSDTRKGTIGTIFGAMDFDINEFVTLSETTAGQKKQVEIFKSFLDQETKDGLSKYENHIKSMYEQRTETNKDIKRLEGAIRLSPLYLETPNLDKYVQVDVVELTKKKDEIRAKLNKLFKENQTVNEGLRKEFEKLKNDARVEVETFNFEQEKNKNKIVKATECFEILCNLGYKESFSEEGEVSKFINSIPKPQPERNFLEQTLPQPKFVQEMPDDKELKEIDEQIVNASNTNRKYDEAQALKKQIQQLKEAQEEAGDLTVKIETERQLISNTIKDMSNMVEGLEFFEDMEKSYLLYNGIPVNSNSLATSQIIELGYLMARAANPKCDIMFIPNSNLLGQERYDAVFQLANKYGMQVIAEEVVRGKNKLEIQIIGE